MTTPGERETVFLRPAQRVAAVNALGEHYANGRLTADECRERVTAAYAAHTNHDLDVLFADLPGPAPVPVSSTEPAVGSAEQEQDTRYGFEASTGLPYSPKLKVVGAVLQFLLPFGTGRFYTGHYVMGACQLLAGPLVGIGVVWCWVDGFVLLFGRSIDTSGRPLRPLRPSRSA